MNAILSIKLPRLLIAVACLLVSFFLYAFYRSENTIINLLLTHSLPEHCYSSIRLQVSNWLPIPDVLSWRIPAGFGIFGSSLLTHECVIHFEHMELRLVWLPAVIAMGIEFAQYFHFTDGSFDPWDIVTIVLAALLATWSSERLTSAAFSKPLNWCFGAACLVILFLADIKP